MAYAPDPRINESFGAIEPDQTKFTGDVVNVYYQDPRPEWFREGQPAPKPKLVIVVRDWEKSEDADKAFTRRSKLTISTNKRSMLTKFRKSVKDKLGLDISNPSELLGLAADWTLEDVKSGGFTAQDVLLAAGKPSIERPAVMGEYVPQTADDEDDTDTPNEPAQSESVSEEDKEAFLTEILGDGELTQDDIRKAVAKNTAFRDSRKYAFAAAVSGRLINELVNDGRVVERGGRYRANS